MEVKINKEIRNYTESMFFGLSLRQFVFSVLACGVAVGLYFILRPHFGTETLSWVTLATLAGRSNTLSAAALSMGTVFLPIKKVQKKNRGFSFLCLLFCLT